MSINQPFTCIRPVAQASPRPSYIQVQRLAESAICAPRSGRDPRAAPVMQTTGNVLDAPNRPDGRNDLDRQQCQTNGTSRKRNQLKVYESEINALYEIVEASSQLPHGMTGPSGFDSLSVKYLRSRILGALRKAPPESNVPNVASCTASLASIMPASYLLKTSLACVGNVVELWTGFICLGGIDDVPVLLLHYTTFGRLQLVQILNVRFMMSRFPLLLRNPHPETSHVSTAGVRPLQARILQSLRYWAMQ
ncbi:hypothetical protein F5I97DRAFT_1826695 [Phlebopus sp. FC_14]|nr:hypothetical protein F5I97DRAFT_1826695 [Phlebopus sp. FC_14]